MGFISRWVGRLRTVGIQRGTQQTEDDISEFEFPNRSERGASSSQLDEPDVPCSPNFFSTSSSSSSTTWGSSIPSTPGGGGTFTPGYVGGAPSPGAMMIPIGAMSLSSRYNTPRSSIMTLPGEEEEEEEGDGDVKKREREGCGVVEEKGLEMDVDVDV